VDLANRKIQNNGKKKKKILANFFMTINLTMDQKNIQEFYYVFEDLMTSQKKINGFFNLYEK
jgi:hypothetical protein